MPLVVCCVAPFEQKVVAQVGLLAPNPKVNFDRWIVMPYRILGAFAN